jgi:alpha-L-arabinofuranosidase
VEGVQAPYWYKWNETVGDLKDRYSRPSAWTYEESNGIGLIEYMNWCVDMGLEPSECIPLQCQLPVRSNHTTHQFLPYGMDITSRTK